MLELVSAPLDKSISCAGVLFPPKEQPAEAARALPSNLASRINFTDKCWVWTGSKDKNGYGRLGPQLAHRLVFEALKGPYPKDTITDHLCRNTSCVNPSHLEAVSYSVNNIRGENPAFVAHRLGHCLKGHSASEWRPYGKWMRCYACHREAWTKSNSRRRLTRMADK